MNEFWYQLRRGVIYAVSLLPFSTLYAISDALYPIVFHIVRYRRRIVEKNLRNSFPEMSDAERHDIEKRFYRSFCDSTVEMFKLLSISRDELMQRMTFSGIDDVNKSLETHPQCFLYLGHFCNWEWISSMPLWFRPDVLGTQLYHPMHSQFFNRLFLEMRTRFGAENIRKTEALRRLLTLKAEKRKTVVGFISDQTPRWVNIHDWVTFMNQDTPVYTGTERIAKKIGAAVFFANVECLSRGHYHCSLELMTNDVGSYPDYKLTEEYMARLEQMIRRRPESWLWTHNRWKRSRTNAPQTEDRHNTQATPAGSTGTSDKPI